ncbi:hypothetical protein VTK73DRAFT_3799 [Phialemonium thermophilum]|uniref:Major facilitator superfamily (MFS) profile domain-containing protein n=1 Tax=Phialemonium thermophilum TaxID=223376 RepID=A0ABR3VEV6_9PEZI
MTGRGFQELKTLRHMTWPMVFVFATFSVTTFSYGFDNVVFATIQAMDDFLLRFGDTTDPQTGKPALSALHQAFYNSLGLPAKALGVVVGGALSNYAGRKPSFMAMQVLCVVGVGLAYGARSFGTMLAGRVCLQGFVGWNALLVPMYSAEIAPAPMRGALVGLFVFAHQFGAFLCSFVTYRSSQHEGSDYAWQLPIAVGFLFPGLMFLVGWFLPESPRWLVRRNRHAKATEALRWLHRGTPDFDADAEVRL